ncbi:hypothetical protein [Propionivibrio sp.]|uniref:hypothetical protein n=1 Tax=Propionivibrio sp. TaxID=2212460 RepID=UPI003BF18305
MTTLSDVFRNAENRGADCRRLIVEDILCGDMPATVTQTIDPNHTAPPGADVSTMLRNALRKEPCREVKTPVTDLKEYRDALDKIAIGGAIDWPLMKKIEVEELAADGSVEELKAETPAALLVGIPSAEIIEKFHLTDEWSEKLRKPGSYKYLLPAMAQRGQRGGDAHRWNPAKFGAILVEKKERKQYAVSSVIFHKFAAWGDEWQAILDAT